MRGGQNRRRQKRTKEKHSRQKRNWIKTQKRKIKDRHGQKTEETEKKKPEWNVTGTRKLSKTGRKTKEDKLRRAGWDRGRWKRTWQQQDKTRQMKDKRRQTHIRQKRMKQKRTWQGPLVKTGGQNITKRGIFKEDKTIKHAQLNTSN